MKCKLAIDHSQNPPTLSYCCHDRQTMLLSHYTRVLTQWKIHRRAKRKLTKHRQSRLLLVWNKVSGPSAFKLSHFKRNSNNKYRFVALQCVVTDHCIASVQTCEPIVFSYLPKARYEHQKVFYFSRGTHHFSSRSPPKLIYSSVWFVVKGIQLRLLGMRIYIFSEPTI